MSEIRFVDTTLRDGQMSLWALNMKTGMMLPALPDMDRAGFDAMEFFVSVMFKKVVRELNENPWERLRLGTKRITKTRLRFHGGMKGAFEKVPLSVSRLMVERIVAYGITLTRTSHPWNDFSMLQDEVESLRKMGMEDKLQAILEEAGRVRAEFGYPIMVTPLSQFVGSQAAINIILGERYKEVTDQVIQYALGVWGKEGSTLMDPNVKDKILSRPRARELAGWEPPQPSLQEVRRTYGGPGVSDEELLLRFFAGEQAVETMRAAGPPEEYLSATQPLVRLIQEISKRRDYSRIHITKGDL